MSSIGVLGRIAGSVFKESIRDKILYSAVGFAVLIIAASFLLGQLAVGQEVKIIKDLGLAAISLFGHFIAIFIGIGLVSKEVERRSIYALLTKPITRSQLVLGKYTGLVSTLVVNVAIMTAALLVVLVVHDLDGLRGAQEVVGSAGRRSRARQGLVPHPGRARAGDGRGGVLLDVHQPAARGRLHDRPRRRRPLRRRPEELRDGD